jgi:hypothetical protein
MVKPVDHVARRTFRIEAARNFAPGIALSAALAVAGIKSNVNLAAMELSVSGPQEPAAGGIAHYVGHGVWSLQAR